MKRRTFFISSLATATALGSGWWIQHQQITPEKLTKLIRQELPLDENIIAVANRYLETRPHASREMLSKNILQRIKGTPARHLAPALREVVLQDFEIEHITLLDGWILSTTELELCSLRLLLDSN